MKQAEAPGTGFAAGSAMFSGSHPVRNDPHIFPETAASPAFAGHAFAANDYAGQPYPSPSKASRFSKITLMAGVFVVGAAVGLACAWWFSHTGAGSALSRERAAAAMANIRPGQVPQVAGRGGISSSELPYDGKSPPKDTSVPAVAASLERPGSVLPDREPLNDNAVTAKAGVAANAFAGVHVKDAPEDVVPLAVHPTDDPARPEDDSKTLEGANHSSLPVAQTPSKPSPSAGGVKAAERTPPAAVQEKQKERKTAKAATDRQRASKHAVNEREIRRIREQASEELRYKQDSGSPAEEARLRALGAKKEAAERAARDKAAHERTQSGALRTASKSAMIARCERISNIIRREQCKWEVCGGMWGKNGCPSYEHQANAY